MEERLALEGGTSYLTYLDWRVRTPKGVVICLHGFPDNFTTFAELVPALLRAELRVVVPALRGYESVSACCRDFTLRALADDTLLLLDVLAPPPDLPVFIVGHDWGAAIAAVCSLRQPSRLRSVVLMSVPHNFLGAVLVRPMQLWRSWYMFFFQMPFLPEYWLLRCKGLEYIYRTWSPGHRPSEGHIDSVRKTLESPGVARAALTYYRRNLGGSPLGRIMTLAFLPVSAALLTVLRIILPRKAAPALEGPIKVPVLAITGEKDGCIGSELFDAAMGENQQLVPAGLQLVRVPGAGHWVHKEKPEAVNTLILKHISSLSNNTSRL